MGNIFHRKIHPINLGENENEINPPTKTVGFSTTGKSQETDKTYSPHASTTSIDYTFCRSILSLETEFNRNEQKIQEMSVFIVTWNMGGKGCPKRKELGKFLSKKEDIVVIGTQECCRSIGKNMFHKSKKKWEDKLDEFYINGYMKIKSCTLVGIHLIVYVKTEFYSDAEKVRVCYIPTGLYDKIGNKGAVSISLEIFKTKILFINCHLAAFYSKHEARDKHYQKIVKKIGSFHGIGSIFKFFDAIFFFGDTNYRINGNRELVELVLKKKMYDVLLKNDQLKVSKGYKDAFHHFSEGEIKFNPTYKFDKNCDEYDTSGKKRIPSWTDRILYYSQNEVQLQLVKYDACFECKYSDHRPVFANFTVKSGL